MTRLLLIVLALAAWATATPGALQDQAGQCPSGEPEPVLDAASPKVHSHVFKRRIAKAETAGFASVLASALESQERAGAHRFREPITITEGYASAELDVVSGEQGRATVRVSYQVVL